MIKNILKELSPWENIKSLNTNIKNDILAGITVAIIALPLALAFGEISQLGPEAGIWSAVVGGVIGGLFGGCLVGVSGPTAPMASQIAAFMGAFVIGSTNEPDLVAAFSIIFLSGLILVLISLLKISRFVNYIPYSAIAGFMCGIGFIVILTQINAFVGLESEKNLRLVFVNIDNTIKNININALYVAIPSLFIMLVWDKINLKISALPSIPAPLVALIFGSSIAYFMNLDIPYIGDKMTANSQGQVFSLYIPELSRIGEFLLPAFSLAGLAVLDSLLSCKVADNLTMSRHSSDRETFGQGMANMAAGLFGGISTATATTQTVGNITFGAKTPLSTIVKGLTMFAILSGFGFLVAAIPNACLAAILFKIGVDILDYRIIPVIKKLPLTDFLIFLIVFVITIYKNIMLAVAVGVFFGFLKSFKLIISIYKRKFENKIIPFSKSDYKLADRKNFISESTYILKMKGPLFFGRIDSIHNAYEKISNYQVLIIDLNEISMIDLSGVFALEDLVNKIKSNGSKVFVLNNCPKIKTILINLNFIENIGFENYLESEKF